MRTIIACVLMVGCGGAVDATPLEACVRFEDVDCAQSYRCDTRSDVPPIADGACYTVDAGVWCCP